MDKLELDYRVSHLERRASLFSLLFSLAGIAALAAAFVTTARMMSTQYDLESATISTPGRARPTRSLS